LGSAGGWYSAIEYGLKGNYDVIWLMDDDGFPDRTSLGNLLEGLLPGIACVSPVVVDQKDPARSVFPFPAPSRLKPSKTRWNLMKIRDLDSLVKHSSGGIYPFAHLFNGALMPLETIRKIGNVRREFFIYGDEVDFYHRLNAVGQVITLVHVNHYHPSVDDRPLTATKVYYGLKNSLILNGMYHNASLARAAALVLVVMARILARNGLLSLFSYLFGKQAQLFYQAIKRGLQGRLGRDFE
jgi:GT2 family glycosyltransferase